MTETDVGWKTTCTRWYLKLFHFLLHYLQMFQCNDPNLEYVFSRTKVEIMHGINDSKPNGIKIGERE